MKKQMKWGIATLILLLGIAAVFIFLDQNAELRQLEKETAESDKLRQERNKPQETPQVQPPPQKAHVHADGNRHEEQHHDPIETEPSREYNPSPIQIPEGITDPDVKAAWERLDYISKNIWEWGGQPSAEAMELVAQLMPAPDGFSGPTGHSDAEETIELLAYLTRYNDPRAAEVFVTYYCEGRISGGSMENALVEIGPPAVPLLIPYFMEDPIPPAEAVKALGGIAEKYREDLGGVVEHIIIPRLEVIAAIENPPAQLYFTKKWAQEALARLK